MNLLSQQDHRPWPAPRRPWIMVQVWRDLLFAHWEVPADVIRPLVASQLELDTFEGKAWISITPFHMSIRPLGLPALPGMCDVPELNCRTYVTVEGKPGIYFFSLDIANRLAMWGARTFYHLPYFHAEMHIEKTPGFVAYSSRRGRAAWRAKYGPVSPPRSARSGSLDYFLAERYCLYTTWRGRIYRGEIHHLPWKLQKASATIEENTVAEAAGAAVSGTPDLLSFASELKVFIWPLAQVHS